VREERNICGCNGFNPVSSGAADVRPQAYKHKRSVESARIKPTVKSFESGESIVEIFVKIARNRAITHQKGKTKLFL
jgi:hypothetical protein